MAAKIRFEPGEQLLAELNPSRRSVVFPVLELVVLTGVLWLAIGTVDGWLDSLLRTAQGWTAHPPLDNADALPGNPQVTVAVWLRRALVVVWVVAAWRRCLRHLLFRRRSRMLLTDRRLITATGHVRSEIGQLPLSEVIDVSSRGRTVTLHIRGSMYPVVLHDVPSPRKFIRLLRSALPVRYR